MALPLCWRIFIELSITDLFVVVLTFYLFKEKRTSWILSVILIIIIGMAFGEPNTHGHVCMPILVHRIQVLVVWKRLIHPMLDGFH